MFYKKNKEKELSDALFKEPTSEYRGAPFWAWNCELKKDELLWQIEQLKKMGFGGFHMHSRSGMATPYLSEEFMDLVRSCAEKAEKEDMLAYLYDEDRWPSGAAGGLVTKDRRFAQRNLVLSVSKRDDAISPEEAYKTGGCAFVAAYDIVLDENGDLSDYKRIGEQDRASGTKWYAYTYCTEPTGWFNNQSYINTLSKEAMDKFIDVTYEAYKQAIGDKFGKTVYSIFTDEPQFTVKQTPDFAESKKDIIIPWTMDFDERYIKLHAYSILDRLPEIFWELPNKEVSYVRYEYHDFVTELFVESFADNCGRWCEENGINLTGHVLSEESLYSQTSAVGEAMRSYRSFGYPGIDTLCDFREYTTAKQAESASHQFGKEGVLSELYGVTNWDFDFRRHKFQGDWEAALGITLRVPHLSWVSMKGDAKRDYPASLNYQSPWYEEYKYVEDHFARLNTALTRGKAIVKVGVIHPIETYWLHYGSKEKTSAIRTVLDDQFHDICKWLLSGCIDFDYIAESLLPSQAGKIGKTLSVGKMEYDVIVVAGCETLRSTTVEILKRFSEAGGRIIFAQEAPRLVDARPSDEALKLYESSEVIHLSKTSLLNALSEEKLIDIREENAQMTENLMYQLRQDNTCRWLFIAHMEEEPESKNIVLGKERIITVKGEYTPVLYNTLNGNTENMEYELKNGNTVIHYTFFRQDSVLIKLSDKTDTVHHISKKAYKTIKNEYVLNKVDYQRSEPNVLLLDIAEFKTDDGEFSSPEQNRKIEYIAKKTYGLSNNYAQPWVIEKKENTHTVTLRYRFMSEIVYDGALYATEDADVCRIIFNGKEINKKITGYFTDKSINTIPLPTIREGENILEVTYPLGDRTNVEDSFILGDFNVRLEGTEKTIIQKTAKIGFGDIVMQGMPFYGANITYTTQIDAPKDCSVIIHIPSYFGAAMKVYLDGEDLGIVCYAPYDAVKEKITKGKHTLSITLFGNRHNSFGPLHLNDPKEDWIGPTAWQFMADVPDTWKTLITNHDSWKYEYNQKPMGILASPEIKYVEEF